MHAARGICAPRHGLAEGRELGVPRGRASGYIGCELAIETAEARVPSSAAGARCEASGRRVREAPRLAAGTREP
jgi:hypothetical protein